MSFAMKSGGHLFSQWLRNKLMTSLDYYSPNSVYLDTVASRERETEHGLTMPGDKRDGVTYVAPDRRHAATEGFTTIGAMNSEWNEAYTTAMSQASVMLFVLTPDYLASEWCMQEWRQYQEENARRAAAGRPPLHGLVVGFDSDESTKAFAAGKAETMTVPRVETTGGHQTALGPGGRGSAISEASYQQILGWVGAHGG
jgi:hypothetical protein